ncbi:MAG: phosphoribosylformylglycinamidine cyclo-ligase [Planctomycetaceae bacterium]|nr:phosphoribosylformylglycinamidine cyclo-ligase [Planctomycetaceae bacterium]MCB9951703.1 phosphoribosylformylglycinamidine cyclo-ligase [Planctomycetaceae bacterium]
MAVSYKDAGVDLDQYADAMQRLPQFAQRTHNSRVLPLAGGFAGLFRLFDGKHQYKDPVLVSGTDGVGTKLKVAFRTNRYDTVGVDLVAMCVNDCLCLGAEPLFFLDYLALGKDNPDLIAELVKGVSDGCVDAGAALIGGETAIMPDVYADGEFDMAGFCVGVVEREQLIDGSKIQAGDVLIGIDSSGLHSNGYSLVRKVVFELAGLESDTHVAELNTTVGEALIRPTRIYASLLAQLFEDAALRASVSAIAHITGGGLAENVERLLPKNVSVVVDRSTWQTPAVFDWIQKLGDVEREEMFRVFNMGIGLVLIVRPDQMEAVGNQLTKQGDAWRVIGRVAEGDGTARYEN